MSDTETGKAAMVRVPPPNVFIASGNALTRWEPVYETIYVDPIEGGCRLTLTRDHAPTQAVSLSRAEALALIDLIRSAVG